MSELSKDGSCEKFGYKMAEITSFRTVNFGIKPQILDCQFINFSAFCR